MSKTKTFPLKPKIDMSKPWYLCSDLCYLRRTICRANQEQIFHEMVIAPQ